MSRKSSRHSSAPACEALEGRRLFAVAPHASPAMTARFEAIAAAAHVKADFSRFTADIKTMQAGSHVSTAQYLAVSMDMLNMQRTAMPPSGTRTLGDATYDIIYRMDYSVIEASKSPQGWASKEAALAADFAAIGYNVPPALLDQTMTDMKAMAKSAGVSLAENRKYWNDADIVLKDLSANPAANPSMDPFYYFSEHFAGFIQRSRRFPVPASGPFGLLTPVPGGGWFVSLV